MTADRAPPIVPRRPRALVPLSLLGAWGGLALPLQAEPPHDRPASPDLVSMPPMRVAGAPVRIGGAPPPCVSVDIAGHRSGDPACSAATKLQDAARAAQARAQGDPTIGVPDAARSPATTVGIGSLTAANQRLGGELRGATQLPKRPPTPIPSTPFPRRP